MKMDQTLKRDKMENVFRFFSPFFFWEMSKNRHTLLIGFVYMCTCVCVWCMCVCERERARDEIQKDRRALNVQMSLRERDQQIPHHAIFMLVVTTKVILLLETIMGTRPPSWLKKNKKTYSFRRKKLWGTYNRKEIGNIGGRREG